MNGESDPAPGASRGGVREALSTSGPAGRVRGRRALGRTQLLLAFAAALALLSVPHLRTGIADNGDWARSTNFLLERPVGFPVETPERLSPAWYARFKTHWHDRWVIAADAPRLGWLGNVSSYKLLLAAQVGLETLVTRDREYAFTLGSLPLRAVLLAAVVALVAAALADAPLAAALLFALLAGALAVDSSFVAFLNSAYEDQVGIALLPLVALLVWRQRAPRSTPSRGGTAAALLLAACVGASKPQFAYLPLLCAPFLWAPLRSAWRGRAPALVLVVAAQALAAIPLLDSPTARVNAYHATYLGLLRVMDDETLGAARLHDEPVVRECVGLGAFAQGGMACVARAGVTFADAAALALGHPRATRALMAEIFRRGGDVGLDYLGKSRPDAPSFAGWPIFGAWRTLFAAAGAWLVVAALLLAAATSARARSAARAPAAAALLLALLAATQYLVAAADGLMEVAKHLLVANYAAALALSLGVFALAWHRAPRPAEPRPPR